MNKHADIFQPARYWIKYIPSFRSYATLTDHACLKSGTNVLWTRTIIGHRRNAPAAAQVDASRLQSGKYEAHGPALPRRGSRGACDLFNSITTPHSRVDHYHLAARCICSRCCQVTYQRTRRLGVYVSWQLRVHRAGWVRTHIQCPAQRC